MEKCKLVVVTWTGGSKEQLVEIASKLIELGVSEFHYSRSCCYVKLQDEAEGGLIDDVIEIVAANGGRGIRAGEIKPVEGVGW